MVYILNIINIKVNYYRYSILFQQKISEKTKQHSSPNISNANKFKVRIIIYHLEINDKQN